MEITVTEKKKIGFATLPVEKVRELAKKGGQSAHRMGKAYEWNSETGREAGRRGGMATHRKKGDEEKPVAEKAVEGG
jgi:uncharacterized protein